MTASLTSQPPRHGFIRAAWAGEEPLWLVFWLYGAVGGNLFSFIVGRMLDSGSPLPLLLGILLTIAGIPFYIWLNVAIWRCAPNSNPVWSALARLTVVATIGVVVWEIAKAFTGA